MSSLVEQYLLLVKLNGLLQRRHASTEAEAFRVKGRACGACLRGAPRFWAADLIDFCGEFSLSREEEGADSLTGDRPQIPYVLRTMLAKPD